MDVVRCCAVCARSVLVSVLLLVNSVAIADARMNINSATAIELAAALKGIGPVKAEAIVHHREQNGLFESVDALVEVKGIGPRTLERLRESITVGAALESQAASREAQVTESVRRVIAKARQTRRAVEP